MALLQELAVMSLYTLLLFRRAVNLNFMNILAARNRKSGNLEIGVPVLGNRLFCA